MPDPISARLLNVDDDEANRYAMTRTLQRAGYEVTEAGTGEDALRLAQQHPDVILLDVKLPDISGLEVARRLKADSDLCMIPILHLSASFITSQQKADGLDAGSDGYLIKPVEPPELLASVRALLRMRHAEDSMRERQAEIENLNERLRRAMAETHHRVKNNLQMICSLVDMQVMEDTETVPMSEMRRLGTHVRTLATIHDLLTIEVKKHPETDSISVQAAMEKLLPMLRVTVGTRRIQANIEEMFLSVRAIASLSLLVNELISNALKHGKGDIELRLTQQDNSARLEVCDDGPGFPIGFDPRKAANTGLELIDSTGRHDLHGIIAYENRAEGGARVVITFPLTDVLP